MASPWPKKSAPRPRLDYAYPARLPLGAGGGCDPKSTEMGVLEKEESSNKARRDL